jgi:hypothetical protein
MASGAAGPDRGQAQDGLPKLLIMWDGDPILKCGARRESMGESIYKRRFWQHLRVGGLQSWRFLIFVIWMAAI